MGVLIKKKKKGKLRRFLKCSCKISSINYSNCDLQLDGYDYRSITNTFSHKNKIKQIDTHPCKPTEASRQTDTCSFVHLQAEKLNRRRRLLPARCRPRWQRWWLAAARSSFHKTPDRCPRAWEPGGLGHPRCLPPLLHCHDAGSSSDLLGITFNSHAFPGTVGRGAAICPACCATERLRGNEKWKGKVCRLVCEAARAADREQPLRLFF